jgi:alpha-galactosidase
LLLWLASCLAAVLPLAGCSASDDDDDATPPGDDDPAPSGTGDDDDNDDDNDDTAASACGDGVCAEGENCLNCPTDCECSCGDGVCTFGEFCAVCPRDCDCETLAATPPMGWNSWNRFACDIDEALIRQTADELVNSGMRDAGYVYLNLDDCWQTARDADGAIIADPDRFPSGIPALADYVHAKGLKFGLYTCAGTLTCQGRPGSYGYEFQDAQTYADWGVDYVKVDWCNTEGLVPRERYAVFRDAIDAAGGGIVLSICDWGREAPWVWGPRAGELWRTTGDIADQAISMWWNMLLTEPLAAFAGPGAWNDPDMLEVGNGGMTDAMYRTHVSLWAMMAAPLIAGNDLQAMDVSTLEILTNAEVIAVDQDPSGVPGRRLGHLGGLEIWVRPLTLDGARAILLFNDFFSAGTASFDWEQIGLAPGTAAVRDLWAHEDLGAFDGGFSANLGPFESRMLLVIGAENQPPIGETALSELAWKYSSSYLRDVRANANAVGGPLTIAGVQYASGLGAASASQVLYHLGGRCASFASKIGVDDQTEGAGTVVFRVWADGDLLFDSGVVRGGEPARSLQVDLTGRRELKLVTAPAGDSVLGERADWVDARLTCW